MATSMSYKPLKACRDGHSCLLQYENPTEHNATYSHPCCWSEVCREMNTNNKHAHQFTHTKHHASLCKYSSDECNRVTDPEHRRTYRHEGLPDFLMPCKYKNQCRDRSIEHLKKYEHPSSFDKMTTTTSSTVSSLGFTQQNCKYGNECRNQSDPTHCNSYSHPTTTLSNPLLSRVTSSSVHTCKYGNECRDKSDPTHCSRYSHPTTTSSSSLLTRPTSSSVYACKYGNECRDKFDPTHCNRYSHPTATLSSSLLTRPTSSSVYACKYGNECRDKFNPTHCSRYSHPTATLSNSLLNPATSSSVQACKYGNQCRSQSDPTHCSRYSHPATTLSTATPSPFHACKTGDDMQQAYRIGGALAMETLSQSDQLAIKNMPADSIIIVPGTYDHIDRVLDNLNIKYITVRQNEVLTYPFRTDQTVYINCASSFPLEAAQRIRQEVEKGLHIITTDWALLNVLQVAFSDFVRHNGQSTDDEVVGIQVADPNHPLVNGFLPASKHADPQWWLEGGSHPIEIINKEQVRVLIRSNMLGQKYRSDAVLVTFNCRQGNVIHMISHFYLQRSETRDARHQMSAKQYAMDIKASTTATNLVANQGQNLNYAQIQSSSTSAQFIYNQISTRLNSKK